jgi:peptidyl-prolyl cis-trans isomerase C/peptidyl-prolyl cis-trans isomerase D
MSFAYASLDPSKNAELAKINNKVITLDEFNKKYDENLKFFPLKPPTRMSVLEDLIKRELGIQEAKRLGLDQDSEIIDRMNTVLYHALIEKKLSKDFEAIHITDEEAKAYYEKNPEIRTSHIFISLRPNATPQEQKQAYEKIKKIQNEYLAPGKLSFIEVAQKFSEGPSAAMGGDIDYQTKDRLDPIYYETALNLRNPGKVSGIVRSHFGYHIIRLTAVRKWEETDKSQVKRQVFEERRTAIFDNYMKQLRKQAQVETHPTYIKGE